MTNKAICHPPLEMSAERSEAKQTPYFAMRSHRIGEAIWPLAAELR